MFFTTERESRSCDSPNGARTALKSGATVGREQQQRVCSRVGPKYLLEKPPMSDVVQKLCGGCHTPRHDGIDYGDHIERITYLLFLKMPDERAVEVPKSCKWPSIRDKIGTDLTDLDIEALRKLPQAFFAGELVPTKADPARGEGRTFETAEELLERVNAAHSRRAEGFGAQPTAEEDRSRDTLRLRCRHR